MGFGDYVKRGIEIVKLDSSAVMHASRDANAFSMGLLVLLIAGIASAIGQLNLFGIIINPIGTIIGAFVWVGILHIFALLFGGRASYSELFRPLALAMVLNWITVIPLLGVFLGFLAGVWQIVVSVVAVENVYRLSRGKAIAVVLIPLAMLFILAFCFVFFVGTAFLFGNMMG